MIEGGLDIALLVILGYFVLRGLFRGVVKEVVAVLGLFVAFWAAGIYWPLGELHMKSIFDMPGQQGVSSFIIIFAVIYFLLGVISIFVDKIVKLTISPAASALLGAVAGAIKGVLVCGVLMTGAEVFLKPSEPFFTASKIWPHLKLVTAKAREIMPENLQRALTAKPAAAARPAARPAAGAPAPPPALPAAVDWKTIQDLLNNSPEAISPLWREKLRGLSGPEALSPEELKRFISDHQGLFAAPPPASSAPAVRAIAAPAGPAPTWPQPASE